MNTEDPLELLEALADQRDCIEQALFSVKKEIASKTFVLMSSSTMLIGCITKMELPSNCLGTFVLVCGLAYMAGENFSSTRIYRGLAKRLSEIHEEAVHLLECDDGGQLLSLRYTSYERGFMRE